MQTSKQQAFSDQMVRTRLNRLLSFSLPKLFKFYSFITLTLLNLISKFVVGLDYPVFSVLV